MKETRYMVVIMTEKQLEILERVVNGDVDFTHHDTSRYHELKRIIPDARKTNISFGLKSAYRLRNLFYKSNQDALAKKWQLRVDSAELAAGRV